MAEIEFIIKDLEDQHSKEKSMKKRIYLETAINSLKNYEKENRDRHI